MRLKRLYGHQLVRMLRLVVPFLALASVAVPVWNYLDRPLTESDPIETKPRLVENESELTEGLRYFSQKKGETVLSLEARRTRGFEGGRHLLEEVLLKFFGEDGSTPEHEIEGFRCGFVQVTGSVDCEGAVRMQLDENTTGHTTALQYDPATDTIRTLAPTRIIRPGEFETQADSLEVRRALDEYELDGNVRITTEQGAVLLADRVVYREHSNRIEVIGAFQLVSGSDKLRGRQGLVELESETLRPQNVQVLGEASAESFGPENPGRLLADRIDVAITRGVIRSLLATGEVSLYSNGEGDGWSLFGTRVSGFFDSAGQLDAVEANDQAHMVFGSSQELRSDAIRNDLSGSITTTDNSLLDLDALRIRGQDFSIERATSVRFRTDREATIETPEGFFKGGQTEAEFDPGTGELTSLRQTGGIDFRQAAWSGSADRLDVEDQGKQIVLAGDAGVETSTWNIEAARITLNQQQQVFTALDSVRAWSSDSSDPFLLAGERAEGIGGRISFSENAGLWWAASDTQVNASRIEIDQDTRGFLAEGAVASTIQGLKVWADRLEFDESAGQVHYSGGVRALAEDMDAVSDLLEVTLVDGQPNLLVATGAVRIKGSKFEGLGDQAEYTPSTRRLILTGPAAEVSNPEFGDIRGDRLEVDLKTQNVVARAKTGGRIVSTGVSVPQ